MSTQTNTVGTVSPVSETDKVAENARKQSERHATAVTSLRRLWNGRYDQATPAIDRKLATFVDRMSGSYFGEQISELRKSLPKGKEAKEIGPERMASHVRQNGLQGVANTAKFIRDNADAIAATFIERTELAELAAITNRPGEGAYLTCVEHVGKLWGVNITNRSDIDKLADADMLKFRK